jgi:hypothetical protein
LRIAGEIPKSIAAEEDMKNIGLMLICVFMAGLIAMGCSKGGKNAEGPGAEAMKQLCEKSTRETANASGQDMESGVQNQMTQDCEGRRGMYKGNDAALSAFADHILATCEGKTGKDWMDCYTQELTIAQQKAADAAK